MNNLLKIKSLLIQDVHFEGNFLILADHAAQARQQQTSNVFSNKWTRYEKCDEKEKERAFKFQRDWYLKLYGFESEEALRSYFLSCNVIFDAGCGLGYKAAWFAQLAPHALVIGMDISEAAETAAEEYVNVPNLVFFQGDIAKTGFADGVIDYVSCDQVIMHTESPEATFTELSRITSRQSGEIACYFYAKKALPRELLDEYFRKKCIEVTNDELWRLSEQLTDLGQRLTALNATIDVPDIPLLGIKGGEMDLQRFIYWNFMKCFWNEGLGRETSIATNFDWYSPSNARRFSRDEVLGIVDANGLKPVTFHHEDACYSGRFSF